MNRVLGILLVSLLVFPAAAALSPKLAEWGEGPATWIMTSEEQRAWRNVSTDADAIRFIDLFWARRDPTPGTPVNEYRGEHEARVALADEQFAEKRKRGAMTDRGRVYVTMGEPTTRDGVVAQMGMSAMGGESMGNRQLSTRHVWLWKDTDARKFGVAKIEVVFTEDPITRIVQRDTSRGDFIRAGQSAVRKAIVSPDLKEVPAWAPTGGLNPIVPLTAQAPALSEVDEPAPVAETSPAATAAPATGMVAGVSRLTLLSRPINSRATTDPFAVASESTFKGGKDVPWAVQYCSAETPSLKQMLVITGPLDGKSTDQRTKETPAKAEKLSALPGCYVIQAMVPISKLAPGRYKLTVYLDAASGASYTARKEFRID
jgi:GWxTD domain-containing protein